MWLLAPQIDRVQLLFTLPCLVYVQFILVLFLLYLGQMCIPLIQRDFKNKLNRLSLSAHATQNGLPPNIFIGVCDSLGGNLRGWKICTGWGCCPLSCRDFWGFGTTYFGRWSYELPNVCQVQIQPHVTFLICSPYI